MVVKDLYCNVFAVMAKPLCILAAPLLSVNLKLVRCLELMLAVSLRLPVGLIMIPNLPEI